MRLGGNLKQCHPGIHGASAPFRRHPRDPDGEEVATLDRAVTNCDVTVDTTLCLSQDYGQRDELFVGKMEVFATLRS